MKIKFKILICILITTCVTTITLSADIVEKTQNFSEQITSVNLKSNAILHIKIGLENKLIIKTDKSVIKDITASVKDGNLDLMCKGQKKLWWDVVGIFSSNKKIDFYLTLKDLNHLTISSIGKVFIESDINTENFTISNLGTADIQMQNLSVSNFKLNVLGGGNFRVDSLNTTKQFDLTTSGSGHFYFNTVKTPQTDLTITGNSTISMKNLETEQLHALILGSGAIVLHGKANTQNIKVDGSGRYNCNDFITKDTTIKSFGSTSIEVFVEDNLSVDIFGSGMINIDGQPKVRECSIYGKGNLILQKGSQETV